MTKRRIRGFATSSSPPHVLLAAKTEYTATPAALGAALANSRISPQSLGLTGHRYGDAIQVAFEIGDNQFARREAESPSAYITLGILGGYLDFRQIRLDLGYRPTSGVQFPDTAGGALLEGNTLLRQDLLQILQT